MAVVGHSYYYHTSKDTVENIDPGVAQHFAENVLEIVKRMTVRERDTTGAYKPASLLERVKKFEDPPMELPHGRAAASPSATPVKAQSKSTSGSMPFSTSEKGGGQHSRRPDVVFYSLAGLTVIVYSGTTARIMYTLWAVFCIGMVWAGSPAKQGQPDSSQEKKAQETAPAPTISHASLVGRSVLHLLFTLVLAVVYSNILAFIMRTVLGRQLTWFAGIWRPVGLYAWPALLGTHPQHLVSGLYTNETLQHSSRRRPEYSYPHTYHQSRKNSLLSMLPSCSTSSWPSSFSFLESVLPFCALSSRWASVLELLLDRLWTT